MVTTTSAIQELSNRIARQFLPERIILFGSHAYGSPGHDSDVDLLVVMHFEGSARAMASAIRRAVGPSFALDILAYRPDHLSERIAKEDFFLREIVARGKVLYEAAHA